MAMNVYVIPMLSDNFSYYLYKAYDIQKGFFVDVAEAEKAKRFLETYGILGARHVLTTHKHGDHSGGNVELIKAGFTVVGGSGDNIPGCTMPVNDGDEFEVPPGINVKVLHTPCHTKGHVLYYCQAPTSEESKDSHPIEVVREGEYQHVMGLSRCVFTGDTVFLGGCGRFFEGTAVQMLTAMDRFSQLPLDTSVFCGHEYTLKNLEFGMQAEPSNAYIKDAYKLYSEKISYGLMSVPGSIKEELLMNVFLRCHEPSIHEACNSADPTECMAFLREYKNTGVVPNLKKDSKL